MRTVIGLNSAWAFAKENAASTERVTLPHTWNAQDGSDGGSDYDRTRARYVKEVYIGTEYRNCRVYAEFAAAGIVTELYVNGIHVPHGHRGGFSRFRFDITDFLKYGESNTFTVSVDNRKYIDIVPLEGDFNMAGGLYGDVSLVITSPVHIDMDDCGADGVYLTAEKADPVTGSANTDFRLSAAARIVNDSTRTKTVTIRAVLRHPDHFDVPDNDYIKKHLRFDPDDMYVKGGKEVGVFAEKTIELAPGADFDYADTMLVCSPRLWDGLRDPYMYEVKITVETDGAVCDELVKSIGFRYFTMPSPAADYSGGRFFLNGREYVLRGACKHRDWGRGADALGYAVTERERLSDAGVMYELGMNAVRLVHYQHDEREIELYDRLGIIVWSELGFSGQAVRRDADGYGAFVRTTLRQLEEMIKQLYNHPSIMIWSLSNEVVMEIDDRLEHTMPENGLISGGYDIFTMLDAAAKRLDPTRKTSYAAYSTFGRKTDWDSDSYAMNLYPYWYTSHIDKIHGGAASMTEQMHRYFGLLDRRTGAIKPMGISEYGASGIIGCFAPFEPDGTVTHPGECSYTETYQAYCHEKVYNEITSELPYLWCSFVWQLFDSASDKKASLLPGINDKGLVRYDHVSKKDAYYFYKANWNDIEPFAHISSSSTRNIVKVYSNCERVQLYVNGKPFGEPITDVNENDSAADGLGIFRWYDVPDGTVTAAALPPRSR